MADILEVMRRVDPKCATLEGTLKSENDNY